MTLLRERLRPTTPATRRSTPIAREHEPLWLRYADLVALGYSPETSRIVAGARVPLDAVTSLLAPDDSLR
jgi:hypothetical protein